MTAAGPVVITVAPNGAYKLHQHHPGVPLTAAALARDAKACLDAGAAMMHLHVRDAAGRHSLDVERYREALAAVRQAVGDDLVLQVTSEAAGVYGPAEQVAAIRALRPEAVSVALRELERPGLEPGAMAAFFAWLAQQGVMTQVILYDAADLQRWHALRACGAVPAAPWFLLFVLGRYRESQLAEPRDLLPFLAAHQGPEPWAVCAFGQPELACVTAAAALGGHVRVGFENNLQLADGARAPDNAALVAQAAAACRLIGRPLASAADVRRRFAAVA